MNLKEIQKEKKITNVELSELSNVPLRTIEDIRKRGNCEVKTAIKLADALGVSLDELCRDKE